MCRMEEDTWGYFPVRRRHNEECTQQSDIEARCFELYGFHVSFREVVRTLVQLWQIMLALLY
jgi:hypothetical protein